MSTTTTTGQREPATVELAYQESGQGDPLLLVMGLGASGDAWLPHSSVWSRRYRCVVVDNRGAGRSPAPPGPYTTATMADDYARLIRRLGTAPVRVVGISMGGAIAQELALRHPHLVARIVLVATWARCDAYTAEWLSVLTGVRAQADSATARALLQSLIWTPRWFAEHLSELLDERATPSAMSQQAFESQATACASHNAYDRLHRIAVPTLVTAGAVDAFIHRDLSAEVAERIPGARLELFAGGHAHHWEDLDRFNEMVEGWLA